MVTTCDGCGLKNSTTLTRKGILFYCSYCLPRMTGRIEDPVSVRQVPDVRCACCYTKAHKVTIKDHLVPGDILRDPRLVNQVDLNGWLIAEYPYRDPMMALDACREGTLPLRTPFKEKTAVCPRCAPQVMGTVKHMADGWRTR